MAIVLIVLVALLALGGFFVWRAVSGFVGAVGGVTNGAGAACSAVSTADVNAALGGVWTVFQLGGLSSVAGPVLDSRVLPDAPTPTIFLTCSALRRRRRPHQQRTPTPTIFLASCSAPRRQRPRRRPPCLADLDAGLRPPRQVPQYLLPLALNLSYLWP